ncbi:hypothetical protein BGZ99_002092, partial [Dissophora globulifera]
WPIYSGYVIATPNTAGSVAVHVPYTGLKGDFSKMPIQDSFFGYPGMWGRDSDGNQIFQSPGTSFDVRGPVIDNLPVVVTREISPTMRMMVRVFDTQNVFLGYLYSPDLGVADVALGRDKENNSLGGSAVEEWTWVGDVMPEGASVLLSLPSGAYRVEVASQKKFTPGVYPQDYEIFDLGTYNILTNNGVQQPLKKKTNEQRG